MLDGLVALFHGGLVFFIYRQAAFVAGEVFQHFAFVFFVNGGELLGHIRTVGIRHGFLVFFTLGGKLVFVFLFYFFRNHHPFITHFARLHIFFLLGKLFVRGLVVNFVQSAANIGVRRIVLKNGLFYLIVAFLF